MKNFLKVCFGEWPVKGVFNKISPPITSTNDLEVKNNCSVNKIETCLKSSKI